MLFNQIWLVEMCSFKSDQSVLILERDLYNNRNLNTSFCGQLIRIYYMTFFILCNIPFAVLTRLHLNISENLPSTFTAFEHTQKRL